MSGGLEVMKIAAESIALGGLGYLTTLVPGILAEQFIETNRDKANSWKIIDTVGTRVIENATTIGLALLPLAGVLATTLISPDSALHIPDLATITPAQPGIIKAGLEYVANNVTPYTSQMTGLVLGVAGGVITNNVLALVNDVNYGVNGIARAIRSPYNNRRQSNQTTPAGQTRPRRY